jgi:serine-type D-Ala-D-Ala carboxypeptidase (penicillin-binding protein 5/6)
LPTGQASNAETKVEVNEPLTAPIVKGETYGKVNIVLNNQVLMSKPLIALANDPRGGIIRRTSDSMSFGFHKLFTHTVEKANNG